MKTYIIRRLLLMPLTLLGVTFLVFCITRFVPGGPIEQMMQQIYTLTDTMITGHFIGDAAIAAIGASTSPIK